MREVQIAPQEEGKGRTFRAVLLASVEADLLWTGGETVTDKVRPVWAMFGGSDQEMRAFVANLTSGRKMTFTQRRNNYRHKEDHMEFLKSAGYQVSWQREDEGVLATVFLPELFQIDPGMVDPDGANFIMLPNQAWLDSQQIEAAPLIKHAHRCGYKDLSPELIASWGPVAYLFAAYLDRRTRCPLYADGRFYMQLMLSCLKHELATFSSAPDRSYHETEFGMHPGKKYHEVETLSVGLAPGLAFRADHETLEKLLAYEVERFFKFTQGSH